MGKVRISVPILFLSGLMAFPAYATNDVDAKQFLLDQVLWGESYYRESLLKQTLSRLDLIAPDDPDVLAAEIRFAIHQHHLVKAQVLLEKLRQKAPDSALYQQSVLNYKIAQPASIQKLQQARLLAMSGRPILAKEQYDSLIHGNPPTPELAAEYWIAVSAIPEQRQNAFKHLQELYDFLDSHKIFPDNSVLLLMIAVCKGQATHKQDFLSLDLVLMHVGIVFLQLQNFSVPEIHSPSQPRQSNYWD